MIYFTFLAGIAALAVVIVVRRAQKRLRLKAAMPPGPKLPWFGLGDNKADMPAHEPWKTFTKWNEQYGPVTSVIAGPTNIIVLGSIKAARDLLEKRGNIYSSRVPDIVAGEIYSGYMRGVGMPYGQRWRNWRALVNAGLSTGSANIYQSLEAKLLLKDLMDEKDYTQYPLHLRRFSVSVVTNLGYGKRIQTLQDKAALESMEIDKYFDKVISSRFIVDNWPILLRLPKWLQWFRWEPERMRQRDTKVYLGLLNEVKERIVKGTAKPSIAVRGLEKQEGWGLTELELAYACSSPWQAGGSSVTQTMLFFLMAMMLYPDAMRKAQEEIDCVVGRNRQPEFKDMDSLPYLSALCKEVFRWRPAVPLAMAHCNTAADVYEGMYIPAGSKIFPNIDLMSKDPVTYPCPEEFKPERFLGPNPAPAFQYAFGFGRRQCPGIRIASDNIFIIASKILWAFDILPRIDPLTGCPVTPNPDNTIGDLIRVPADVPCMLRLRGNPEQTRAVILAEAEAAEIDALEFNF